MSNLSRRSSLPAIHDERGTAPRPAENPPNAPAQPTDGAGSTPGPSPRQPRSGSNPWVDTPRTVSPDRITGISYAEMVARRGPSQVIPRLVVTESTPPLCSS